MKMADIIIDYKGNCPNCDRSDFEVVDEFGEELQWIKCRYCSEPIHTENGKIVEE